MSLLSQLLPSERTFQGLPVQPTGASPPDGPAVPPLPPLPPLRLLLTPQLCLHPAPSRNTLRHLATHMPLT